MIHPRKVQETSFRAKMFLDNLTNIIRNGLLWSTTSTPNKQMIDVRPQKGRTERNTI